MQLTCILLLLLGGCSSKSTYSPSADPVVRLQSVIDQWENKQEQIDGSHYPAELLKISLNDPLHNIRFVAAKLIYNNYALLKLAIHTQDWDIINLCLDRINTELPLVSPDGEPITEYEQNAFRIIRSAKDIRTNFIGRIGFFKIQMLNLDAGLYPDKCIYTNVENDSGEAYSAKYTDGTIRTAMYEKLIYVSSDPNRTFEVKKVGELPYSVNSNQTSFDPQLTQDNPLNEIKRKAIQHLSESEMRTVIETSPDGWFHSMCALQLNDWKEMLNCIRKRKHFDIIERILENRDTRNHLQDIQDEMGAILCMEYPENDVRWLELTKVGSPFGKLWTKCTLYWRLDSGLFDSERMNSFLFHKAREDAIRYILDEGIARDAILFHLKDEYLRIWPCGGSGLFKRFYGRLVQVIIDAELLEPIKKECDLIRSKTNERDLLSGRTIELLDFMDALLEKRTSEINAFHRACTEPHADLAVKIIAELPPLDQWRALKKIQSPEVRRALATATIVHNSENSRQSAWDTKDLFYRLPTFLRDFEDSTTLALLIEKISKTKPSWVFQLDPKVREEILAGIQDPLQRQNAEKIMISLLQSEKTSQ